MAQRRSLWTGLFDAITVLFVSLTVAVIALVVLILDNPNTPLNPFPPPTVAPILQLPTLTPSATPTATPTATYTPSITPTPSATFTPTDTDTPTPSATPTATATQVINGTPMPVQPAPDLPTPTLPPLDDGSGGMVPGLAGGVPTPTLAPFPFMAAPVRYQANTDAQGCQWLSVAGTISGLAGEPLPGLAVQIVGESFRSVRFSGSAERWGEAGFEFQVGVAPRPATFTLYVIGPAGTPISETVTVETGTTCDTNIALVDFVQNHPY
jgi:hypothetical protein